MVVVLAWGTSACLYQSAAPEDQGGVQDTGEDTADTADIEDLGDDDAADAMDAREDAEPDVPVPDEEQSCTNGDDEDRDGLTDCADTDCLGAERCGRIIFGVSAVTNGAISDENDEETLFRRVDAICAEVADDISGLDPDARWRAVLGTSNTSAADRAGGNDGYV